MKKKKLSLLRVTIILSIFSSASVALASSCTKDEKSLDVLRSSWIDEDLAFLDGRKQVGYMFESNTRNYRIYQEGAFLGDVIADPFYQEEIDKANELISRLNTYIDLKLNEVSSRREADLVIIGVCEDTNITGMVADNEFGDQYYLLLNGCNGVLDVEGQPVLLFLHELGHALGLEHPFDDSDGDCLHSDEPWSEKSTDASVTVMAYKSSEKPIGFFTDLDLATLQSIHGVAEDAPKNFLLAKPATDSQTGGNNRTTLERWIRQLGADFDDLAFEPVDENSYLISVGELSIFVKLFDSLLWIMTYVGDPHDSSNSALAKLLELSQQISYAYVGLEDGTVTINYELPMTGSTYEAFQLGFRAVVQGFFTAAEELDAPSGNGANEKTPDITQNKDTSELRFVEPGDLGVAIGFGAFDWDVEESSDSAIFTYKGDTEKYMKVFVESLAIEIVDDRAISAILNNYLESQESYQEFSVVNTGTRSVDGKLAAWGQYSLVTEGLKFYFYTTVVSSNGRLVSLHTWSGRPEWNALENHTAEFLKNIKW